MTSATMDRRAAKNDNSTRLPVQNDRPGRWTLSGAFLGITFTASLFAVLFSPYWLILAGFAFLGFTQSWSFDLAHIEQRERQRD